jgi:hypothetical protein
MEEIMPPQGTVEAKDNFAPAPPGHSLTEDNTKWAWGKPPKVAEPEQALEQAINSLKEGKIQLELVKLLIAGASIEMIVEGYLFQGFQEGRFSPDVAVLIKAPLAFYIASIAEESNVPYRFFENKDALDQGTMDDATLIEMMQQNNPSMFNFIREKINQDIREGNKPPKSAEGFLGVKGGKK